MNMTHKWHYVYQILQAHKCNTEYDTLCTKTLHMHKCNTKYDTLCTKTLQVCECNTKYDTLFTKHYKHMNVTSEWHYVYQTLQMWEYLCKRYKPN